MKIIRKLQVLLLMIPVLGASQGHAEPLRVSYSSISPVNAGLWVAQEVGAFKRHSLDVKFIYISSSGTNVQALLGGSLDVATAGASGIFTAAARGALIVAVGAIMNRTPATLYVQPEITKIEELKGKALAISGYGSAGHAITVLLLRKFGLEKDVFLMPVGGVPQRLAAFERKTVAGVMTAVKPNVPSRALLNAGDLDIPLPYSIMAITRNYLRDHPDLILRFLRGYIEGVALMLREKETSIKILAKYLNRTDRPFLEETYNFAVTYTDRVPTVDPRAVSTVLEFSDVKGIIAETLVTKVIDNSLVDKLVEEKFIEKLFGKEVR